MTPISPISTQQSGRQRGRVRELREGRGLSQYGLALATGGDASIATVTRFDAGLLPKRDTPALHAVANALGVTVEQLRGVDA